MLPSKDPDSATLLDLSDLDIASLFVKFINPRYAVALTSPDYFVTHPEYGLQATAKKIKIHERVCHALAVSHRAKDISYTFNPASHSAQIGFLDLLAVGVEYTFKYFEQYFRWPALNMQLSRYSSLASWSNNFVEHGAKEYNRTTLEIDVSGLAAAAQQRSPVTSGRMQYARTILEYNAALYEVYTTLARHCPDDVRRAIALAICLPGFRKALMREQQPLTVLLPVSDDITQVFEHIYSLGDPSYVIKLLLMHMMPGQLRLRVGQSFVLDRTAERPAHRPRSRVIEPELSQSLSDTIVGRIASQATALGDDLTVYSANIRYGSPQQFIQRFLADHG